MDKLKFGWVVNANILPGAESLLSNNGVLLSRPSEKLQNNFFSDKSASDKFNTIRINTRPELVRTYNGV